MIVIIMFYILGCLVNGSDIKDNGCLVVMIYFGVIMFINLELML